jgi:hypothetical protein
MARYSYRSGDVEFQEATAMLPALAHFVGSNFDSIIGVDTTLDGSRASRERRTNSAARQSNLTSERLPSGPSSLPRRQIRRPSLTCTPSNSSIPLLDSHPSTLSLVLRSMQQPSVRPPFPPLILCHALPLASLRVCPSKGYQCDGDRCRKRVEWTRRDVESGVNCDHRPPCSLSFSYLPSASRDVAKEASSP